MRPVSEQTILITGATDGLGRAVALELAREGATLLLHGRDDARGEETLRELRDATGNEKLSFYRADLASLAEARALAERVREEHDRLDVLVNNAGVGMRVGGETRRHVSHDGHELRLAVNYLAPYVLSRSLLPLLAASAPSRIVNVTSLGQEAIDFDDLMVERDFDGFRAYRRSKLALVMLTFDLAEELEGTGVTVNCLHPGTLMPTKMVLEAGVNPVDSLETGIRSTYRLIASPELDGVSGRYFDRLEEAEADPQAYDREARARLRELTEQLVGPVRSA